MGTDLRGGLAVKRIRCLALATAALAVLLGAEVMAEWVVNSRQVSLIRVDFVPVAPSTAMSFVLLGTVLFFRRLPIRGIRGIVLHLLAGAVLILGTTLACPFCHD